MPHPDHDCPPLVRWPSSKRSRNRQAGGAENRNLWTTRARNAPLWTTCGTPRFRTTLDSGKSYFPHILLRRGHSRAQLTRAGNPTRPGRPSEGRGNDSIHHSDDDGSGYDEQRDPQDSVSRASCPQIFADDPE